MVEKWKLSPREETEFVNVFMDEKIRNQLTWTMKPYSPKHAFNHLSNDTNPLVFRYRTLIDLEINDLMRKEFPDEYACHHFVKLNSILNEMGYSKNIVVIRSLGLILVKIMKKILSSVYINEYRFLKLRTNMGRNPVIFLPTHRSYADFILMAFLCFHYNVEIPIVVAGMDFYGMFGMAALLRQCGAMYMRRSFRDDKIYAAVLKKYIQTVISMGNSPFEFFIEGTRSRCGKSLAPKFGILKTVVSAYTSNRVKDITFVPISISYDRLMEDKLFAREVIGIPKPRESTTSLLRAMGMLEDFYGSIYINFGNEISLKRFEQDFNSSDDILVNLANTIIKSQQENLVVTFSNLFCTAVMCGLMSRSKNFANLTFLHDVIVKLRRALTLLGAILAPFDNFEEDVKRTLRMHTFLKINEERTAISITPYTYRGTTDRNILENATTVIVVQHYSNSCYHFLVNPTIIVSILYSQQSLNEYDLFERFKLCRKLFKYEFLFFEPFERQDFEKAVATLHELQLIGRVHDKISACRIESNTAFWLQLFIPYLRGYLFICRSILQIAADKFTDDSKLGSMIKKKLLLELENVDDFNLYYSFSSNLLSCTLLSLNDLSAVRFKSLPGRIEIVDIPQLRSIVQFLGVFEIHLYGDQMNNLSSCATNCKL